MYPKQKSNAPSAVNLTAETHGGSSARKRASFQLSNTKENLQIKHINIKTQNKLNLQFRSDDFTVLEGFKGNNLQVISTET